MNDVLDLLVRSVPILLGGGAVQLAIFLLKRRSELRALDAATTRSEAETGSVFVSSAKRSLLMADQVRDNAVRRADEAIKRADGLELDLATQRERVRQVTARLVAVEIEQEDLNAQLRLLRPSTRATPTPPEPESGAADPFIK